MKLFFIVNEVGLERVTSVFSIFSTVYSFNLASTLAFNDFVIFFIMDEERLSPLPLMVWLFLRELVRIYLFGEESSV